MWPCWSVVITVNPVEARNSTRRAVLLKSGAGIGAAALGVGLGALLALYGVSLILHRPTLEEVATVVREQVTTIERQANEKVALAEGAAAAKYAVLTRAAEEKKAAADKAMAEVKTVTEKFGRAGSSKSVVDFTIFRKREVGTLQVTTGWAYKKVGDAAPSHQWCYAANISDPSALSYQIAVDSVAIPFDLSKASRAGVTQQQVHQALPGDGPRPEVPVRQDHRHR